MMNNQATWSLSNGDSSIYRNRMQGVASQQQMPGQSGPTSFRPCLARSAEQHSVRLRPRSCFVPGIRSTLLENRRYENGTREFLPMLLQRHGMFSMQSQNKNVFGRRCQVSNNNNNHCSAASPGRPLKRKPENDQSYTSPSRKQHITEEKMAASMRNLSLESNQNNPTMGSVKQINDDSDFEDDSDIDEEYMQEASLEPVFELHADFKEHMKKLNNAILPESILDNMTRPNDACLAVVPYVPRDDLLLNTLQYEDRQDSSLSSRSDNQMDDADDDDDDDTSEMFIVDWDSDSDNDLVLD